MRNATSRICRELAITGDPSRLSEARYKAEVSYDQVQHAEARATLYEMMLGIPQRWTEETAEYKHYYKENVETEFRESVDELEQLVVMWISEVAKLKESGLGTSDPDPLLFVFTSETPNSHKVLASEPKSSRQWRADQNQ